MGLLERISIVAWLAFLVVVALNLIRQRHERGLGGGQQR
jgi:hypothetical protein